MTTSVLQPENKSLENIQVQHELLRRLVNIAQTPQRQDQTPGETLAELRTIANLIVTHETT